jgi:3D (Asp-Asp-Asp) domain-containing protein
MNRKLLIIPFIIGVLVLQFTNAKLNNYQQKIEQLQNNIETIEDKTITLENKVEDNNNKINNIQQPNRGSDRTFEVLASAYTHMDEGCNMITYSENKVREGHTIAVNPDQIPIGSIVYIKSEDEQVSGYYVAEDIGGAISTGRIDLYMEDKERALDFGIQSVEIQIIKYGWNG